MLSAFIQAAIAAYALLASPMEGGGMMLIGGVVPENTRLSLAVTASFTDSLIAIYMNGNLIASRSNEVPKPVLSTAVYIGRVDYPGTSGSLTGEFCELRSHSRALTADEIAANYAVDKARFNLP